MNPAKITTSLTKDEKINYLQIACDVCGLSLTKSAVELILVLHEEILAKGGELTLKGLYQMKNNMPQWLKELEG